MFPPAAAGQPVITMAGFLRLKAENKLEGACGWTAPNTRNPLVTWSTRGSLTGAYDPVSGSLIFHLETQADYPENQNTISITFDGQGTFTSATHAEGNANYRSRCQSNGERGACGSQGLPG